jgi:Ser/Thr protein kinase RdoA (MazF antagonist)
MGPPVHDVWMLIPGQDADAAELRDKLIEAYEIEREFAWETLALIEPLRALKFVHHAAWLAARRDDPAFMRLYGESVSREYWRKELSELEDQLERIEYGR